MVKTVSPETQQMLAGHDLVDRIKELLEYEKHLNEIYKALDGVMDTKKLSKFGRKIQIIRLLNIAHNRLEGEALAKEVLNSE